MVFTTQAGKTAKLRELKRRVTSLFDVRSVHRKYGVKGLTIRAVVFAIGYILSPLSFWNDAFVNVPIAYAIALLAVIFLGKAIFPLAFFAGYLFSNILGLMMMHMAVRGSAKLDKRRIIEMLVFGVLYTIAATLLIQFL